MDRKLILILVVSLTFLFILGCAACPIRRSGEAARNRSNLAKLNLRMTKNEVLNLMGRPAKTEAYGIQGTNLEFWHYRTEYNWQLGTL
jgi:outer membrane protein assembly factor BamE (lipoprotein component of BamABCDE complex)